MWDGGTDIATRHSRPNTAWAATISGSVAATRQRCPRRCRLQLPHLIRWLRLLLRQILAALFFSLSYLEFHRNLGRQDSVHQRLDATQVHRPYCVDPLGNHTP
jgi:hypothetical protein